MNKVSTLFYLVNNFQADPHNIKKDSPEVISEKMEESEKGPSDQTIENIMNFARSYEVFESEETGYVEMNLN